MQNKLDDYLPPGSEQGVGVAAGSVGCDLQFCMRCGTKLNCKTWRNTVMRERRGKLPCRMYCKMTTWRCLECSWVRPTDMGADSQLADLGKKSRGWTWEMKWERGRAS